MLNRSRWALLLLAGVFALLAGMLPAGYGTAQGGPLLAPEGEEGVTYYAAFPVAVTLDGDLSEWDRVPQVYLGSGVGRPAVGFGAAADAEYLYVYADVADTNIISGEHGSDYWNEDSVEIYINATGDLTLTGYTDGVAQLTIPPLNAGLPQDQYVFAGVHGSTTHAQAVVVETDNGWAVEVAFPLENDVWSITPEHGQEIGFQVHLNAASEDNRDTKLIWSAADPGDTSYQNPSVFGRLIFHEVAAVPAASGEYVFSSAVDDDGTVDDFENGLWLAEAGDSLIGIAPLDDAALALRQVMRESDMAFPGQEALVDNVLLVEAPADDAPGGFAHYFTDSLTSVTLDWSAYNALGMWLYGSDSGEAITVSIGDAAFQLPDDFSGWQYVVMPFALFEGAFDPAAVASYGAVFPIGGAVDGVKLFNVEDTAAVLVGDAPPQGALVLDPTIDWDSRTWELVWADEFDAEAGAPVDDTSWTCEVGGWGWGNNELQYYTQSLENAAHNGEGQLVITAQRGQPEDGETCWYGQCAFTSARCITQDKVEFTYGRVEARLRIPTGQGVWPAFWMLGANFPDVGWPDSGEIDIMENIGSEPQTIHGTVHGPGYSGASGIGSSYPADVVFSEDFHVYAIDWDPQAIRWYVDGTLYGTVSVNDLRSREWVFDHDFFLLLNVAVGGAWPGFPDETTTFPQTMAVDYVRVYQLAAD